MDPLEQARRTLATAAPAEYTARRGELVAAAQDAGDRELAGAIRALRKPTQSAWVVNLLVREHLSDLQDYLDLGRVLRARLADLTADELRTVNKDRVAYVRELVADARSLAAERGVRISSAHAAEVEQTLAAAFSDDHAAEAVLAGTLTTGLRYAGLGFGGEVTAFRADRTRVASAARAPAPGPARGTRDEVAAAARRRAVLAAAVGAVDDAQQRLELLTVEVQDAEQDFAAAQLRVAAAERDLQHATADELRAEQLMEAAAAALESGEAQLAELQIRLSELEPDGKGSRT